tara:strand:+ start:267032 stop:267175 length:144 start_codon:yes stop_codon:yes gene_type:complete
MWFGEGDVDSLFLIFIFIGLKKVGYQALYYWAKKTVLILCKVYNLNN